ncbi:MAG: hypothetical protein K2N49_07410 [Ruminococcus sp.]|nr:hypothetical protein [Ruminococcus sp.]
MKKFIFLIMILASLVSCGKKNQTPENIDDIPEIEDISDIESIPETTAGEISTTEVSETEIPETEITGTSGTTVQSGTSQTKKSQSKTKTKLDLKTTTSAESGNKSGNTENNSEPESETPEPIEYREYYAEDFNEIDIQFVKQESEPPVNITEYNIDIKIGDSKMSPCKALYDFVPETEIPEYLDEFPEQIEDYKIEMEKRNEQMRQILENPCAGLIKSYSLCGDNLYFVVSYDDLHEYSYHCFELYQYNIKSNEQTLLYSHEDTETSMSFDYFKEIDGELYISATVYDNDYSYSVFRFDRKNKSLAEISTPELCEDMKTMYIIENSADRLLVSGSREKVEGSPVSVVSEYNPDTKEWSEIFRGDEYYPVVQGNDIGYSEKIDRYISCTVEGKYTIHTGLIGTELKSFSDTQMICFTADSINRFLYIFDMERMERYKIDMKGMGEYFTVYPVNDVFYIRGRLGVGQFILLPEVGIAFQLHTNYDTRYHGSRLWNFSYVVEDVYLSPNTYISESLNINENDFILTIIE